MYNSVYNLLEREHMRVKCLSPRKDNDNFDIQLGFWKKSRNKIRVYCSMWNSAGSTKESRQNWSETMKYFKWKTRI